ncbi:hypothetical protein [Lewinella sp. JB7]|uniref:hypothetical protein n=1 Tax=Lewinella sp. JB7 TaxID=2962887 RepID=UPI0020C97AF2|nr:hypothetical protein [Lewinella sp. JB7]MCP9236829.1 hypothetical protein [Lewinella sp. JB7]
MNPDTNLHDHSQRFVRAPWASGDHPMLSPAYRYRKYALFVLRTLCVAAIYFLLWDHAWIRWTLLITLPLHCFNFLILVGWRYFLEREMRLRHDRLSY